MRAVTFDFWETLVHADQSALRIDRVGSFGEVLACAGHPVDESVLDAVFDRVGERFNDCWCSNTQYGVPDAVRETCELLGLDLDLAPALTTAWLAASRRASVAVAPGAVELLAGLAAAGVKLAVICDVGLTPSDVLIEYLERLGLLEFFDHLTWSDQVGVYKPAGEMFADALVAMGVDRAGDAAHIGDRRRTDVAGSRARGMLSVRYRGLYDDRGDDHIDDLDEADVVADHHDELLTLLLAAPVR